MPKSNSTKSEAERADPKPTRPLSAYNLFFHERRKKLQEESNAYHGTKISFAELARIVAKEWKQVKKSEKAKYEEMAARDKRRFALELIAWKGRRCQSGIEERGTENVRRVKAKEQGQEFDVRVSRTPVDPASRVSVTTSPGTSIPHITSRGSLNRGSITASFNQHDLMAMLQEPAVARFITSISSMMIQQRRQEDSICQSMDLASNHNSTWTPFESGHASENGVHARQDSAYDPIPLRPANFYMDRYRSDTNGSTTHQHSQIVFGEYHGSVVGRYHDVDAIGLEDAEYVINVLADNH